MTFENYQYTRPDTNQIKKQLETLIEKLNSATLKKHWRFLTNITNLVIM